MINWRRDTLLTITQAALALNRSRQQIYKWIYDGRHGVRLEAIAIGGILTTSEEALQTFFEATAEAILPGPKPQRSLAKEKRDVQRAAEELDRLLSEPLGKRKRA
jgi:hypothetical protein